METIDQIRLTVNPLTGRTPEGLLNILIWCLDIDLGSLQFSRPEKALIAVHITYEVVPYKVSLLVYETAIGRMKGSRP